MKISILLGIIGMSLAVVSCSGESSSEENEEVYFDAPAAGDPIQANYALNPDKSYIEWSGSMTGMYDHTGTVRFVVGQFVVENMELKVGHFLVDMNSLETTDSDDLYESGSRVDLIDHLKSEDFFYANRFPTTEFELQSHIGNEINGILSIKGVSRPVIVTDVEVGVNKNLIKIFGTLIFDRQDFDMVFNHPVEDMVIADEVELNIVIYGEIG